MKQRLKNYWYKVKIKLKQYRYEHYWEYSFPDSNRDFYCVKCGKDYRLPF